MKDSKIGDNKFKENVKIFMSRGFVTLIIGFLAVGAYLLVLDLAGKYFADNVTNSLYIEVTKQGELSINYSKTDEEIYVCWETDGGTVKPVKENEKFKEQYTDTNKWYQAYTEVQENVVWDGKDASGEEFSTANVRAIIYEKTAEKGKDQYYLGEYIKEISITVCMKDGEIKKAKDRYFSNPVKKDATEEKWNEIYVIDETTDHKTLRYRTSENLNTGDDDKIYVICWESEGKKMAQTNIVDGSVPHYSVKENVTYRDELLMVDTVTVKIQDDKEKQQLSEDVTKEEAKAEVSEDGTKEEAKAEGIEAYLVDSELYKKYIDENKKYKEKDKKYKAEY